MSSSSISKMENANAERRFRAFGCKEPKFLTHLLLVVASMFLLAIIPFASAGNESSGSINFNHPSSAEYGESFSVSLELIGFSDGMYDVKIDMLNSSGGRIAEILNNEDWRSTFYYLDGAINTSTSVSSSFEMNVTKEYSGTAFINVTLRKGSSTYKFGGYSIDVSIPPVQEESSEENEINESFSENNVSESAENLSGQESLMNDSIQEEPEEVAEAVQPIIIKANSTKTVKAKQASSVSIASSPPEFSITGDIPEEEKEPIYIEMKDDRIKTYSLYLFTGVLLALAGYLVKMKLVSG